MSRTMLGKEEALKKYLMSERMDEGGSAGMSE
jgi:hypothetical protein